jgi:transcriptional regulator with XRE-family HTH domain
MNDSEKTLRQSFKDKEYRHGYVDEFLNAYIATQIKVLREQRGWSQTELAEHAGMMQPRISVMENVNYSSWSIKILRKIAEAFDLTLCVSFEIFGRRIEDIEGFRRETLERNSFDDDPYFKEQSIDELDIKFLEDNYSQQATIQPGSEEVDFQHRRQSNVVQISDYFHRKNPGEREREDLIQYRMLNVGG